MQLKAFCQVTIAPMRAEPNDRAEMISQLLFGELVEIIQKNENWIKIETLYDKYQGWIDYKHILELTETEFNDLNFPPNYVSSSFDYADLNKIPFPLTIGAEIRYKSNDEIFLSKKLFKFNGELIKSENFGRNKIIEIAYNYLNTPYLWGGKSTFGIDCSGFTQMCFKMCNYFLPRDANQQANIGEVLGFLEEAEPGDLAFFENKEGKIIHVGIILGNRKIIHAHGKVQIDSLDNTGIYNAELKKYTHQLRIIKKIIGV